MHFRVGRACPFCGSLSYWRNGKQKGMQRYACLGCGRFFLLHYRRSHHGVRLIRRIVNTYFDTRGSYRRTAKNIGRKVCFARIYRIVNKLRELQEPR